MFLRGNIGSKESPKMMKELRKKPGAILLVPRNLDTANWQFPTEVYYEVENQFIKTREVGAYDVYQ